MFVVDTNVYLYAADRAAPEHDRARKAVETWRRQATPWYTTWGVLYEFMRVVTHPRAPHIRGGALRALAVFSNKKLDDFAYIPTGIEQGYKGEMVLYHVLLAPKGLPPAVRDRLVHAAKKGLELPKYREMFVKASFDPAYMSPSDVARHVESDEREMSAVMKDLGLIK